MRPYRVSIVRTVREVATFTVMGHAAEQVEHDLESGFGLEQLDNGLPWTQSHVVDFTIEQVTRGESDARSA